MIEELARRYGRAPWEITGSRAPGAPAWMQRHLAWIALAERRKEEGARDG